VESVAAEKKAKYSAKVNKAKGLKAKRKADEEETIVTAPPPVQSGSKKIKTAPKPDNSVGGQQTPDKKKKSLKFQEEVEVKEIEEKPQKKKKKEKLEGKINEKKEKIFKKKKKEGDGEKKPFVKLDKKETREKQKKDKSERRTKKLKEKGVELDVYNLGMEAKKIWEELRDEEKMKENEQKKVKLASELHALVKGNIKKIIFAHDTVRVVECLMAMGDEAVKESIFQEMKEDIVEMSKSKYASFFAHKLLRYGSKEQRAHTIKALMGKVAKLMKHKTAATVVELAYNDYADAATRNSMLQEFLGPEFRLFKEPTVRTVGELIAKHPEKKEEIIKNMGANVEVLIQKGTFNHSLVHTVIHNYLAVTDGKRRSDCIESLRNSLVHMAHSRDGAMAAMYCLWHGTAKDRKAIIKSFKTFIEKTCYEEFGHMVLMAIFDTVDDTKLVGKAVLGELAECLTKVMQDKYGLRVVKYLFAGRESAYTYPDVIEIMKKGDGNENSKKEMGVRRSELLESIAPAVLKWLASHLQSGLFIPPTTITFTCLLNHLPASQQLSDVWTLLAEEASKPFIQGDDMPNIIENTASNMLLKKVILKDKERKERGEQLFSQVLLDTVDSAGLEAWVSCNRGAFLLLHCWETGVEEVQTKVKALVTPLIATLRRQAKSKSKGAELLLSKITS